MDEVSSYGYAWGYLGSCIPFLVALIAYVLGPDMVGVLPDSVSKIIGFGVTALWWLIVTLPLLKGYKQKNYVETKAVTVGQTFGKIFGTLKKIAVSDRKVFFFLSPHSPFPPENAPPYRKKQRFSAVLPPKHPMKTGHRNRYLPSRRPESAISFHRAR